MTKARCGMRVVVQTTGHVYYRRSHKRKRLFAHNRSFASANDRPVPAPEVN